MRWSKVRQIAESRFAPSVKGRVRLESTHYHKAPDQEGRVGVVIDGEQVWSRGCIEGDRDRTAVFQELKEQGLTNQKANAFDSTIVRGMALHNQYDFHEAVWDYIQLSIDESLKSYDAVTRSLAFLDARTGKRRLRQLAAHAPRTSLERACLGFRLRAEGIEADWVDAN